MNETYDQDPTINLAFKAKGTRALNWPIVRHMLRGTSVALTYTDERGADLYLADQWAPSDIKETNIAQVLRDRSELFQNEASRVTEGELEDNPKMQVGLRKLGDQALAAAQYFEQALADNKTLTVDYVASNLMRWGAFHD